jgi:hypothetical protein
MLMNQRTLLARLWSPAGFGLVLLLFLLPFLTVSCGGEQRIDSTFTGMDLIIGGAPDMTGPEVNEEVEAEFAALFAQDLDADPFAILGALAVIFGMGVGLARRRLLRHGLAAALALVAGCLITTAVLRAPGRAEKAWQNFAESADLVEQITPVTTIRFGYWAVMVVLAGLLVAHAWATVRGLGDTPDEPDDGEPGDLRLQSPAPEDWASG